MTTERQSQLAGTTLATKARLATLLAIVGLAAACGDTTAPTSPEVAPATVPPAAAKPVRTPYISDLTLHFPYIDIGPDGTYDNGFDLTVSNPGQRTDGIFWQAELQQGTSIQNGDGASMYCSLQAGTLPRGTCRVTGWVSAPQSPFTTGPARLTVRLMQIQNDGPTVFLDTRTVDVIIVHS